MNRRAVHAVGVRMFSRFCQTCLLVALISANDLGRGAVPNGIWDKPGPLTDGEWERVRLHAYYTERVLSRVEALAPLARLAGLHHERLDASGYHRGCPRGAHPVQERLAKPDGSSQSRHA